MSQSVLTSNRSVVRRPGWRGALHRELVKEARREVKTVEDLNVDDFPPIQVVEEVDEGALMLEALLDERAQREINSFEDMLTIERDLAERLECEGVRSSRGHLPSLSQQEMDFMESDRIFLKARPEDIDEFDRRHKRVRRGYRPLTERFDRWNRHRRSH